MLNDDNERGKYTYSQDMNEEGEYISRWTANFPYGSSSHSTERGAEKAIMEQEDFDRKFPWTAPRSEKEMRRAEKYIKH